MMTIQIEQLKQILFNIQELDDDEWHFFLSNLEEKSYPKNTLISSAGDIETDLYFVREGIIRSYFRKPDCEHSLDFSFPGDFITSFMSFITGEISMTNLETLSFVHVYQIKKEKIMESYNKYKNCERIGRKIAEMLYIRKTKRELELLSLSAKERYKSLLQKSPRTVGEIPVKHIASYLGIKPESLSRIRKEIS